MSSNERGPFVVPASLDGTRSDRVVSVLAGVSRAVATALITQGAVRVDGRVLTARAAPLAAGASVDLARTSLDVPLEADPDVTFSVVHEDDAVIVVDKPAGLVVHPGAGRRSGTLAGGLLALYPDLGELARSGASAPDRPGIVHRLDKGTSGLLVVARTEAAVRALTRQLATRQVERRYLALVAGHVKEDRGAVEAPIGRSARAPARMSLSSAGRAARTAYRVLQRYDEPIEATMLSLGLETGRTHQIRVHLAAIGHSVVGDDRYGAPRTSRDKHLLPSGRLFLHASKLSFSHPADGQRVTWVSGLPEDLRRVIGAERGDVGGDQAEP